MPVLLVPGVQQQRYGYEIKGLRALAVVKVVINYLDPKFLPSGYLWACFF